MPQSGQRMRHQKNASNRDSSEIQAPPKRSLRTPRGSAPYSPARLAREPGRCHRGGFRVVPAQEGAPMRQIIFGVCVLTAACSGSIPDSPTAPSSATGARDATVPASQTLALSGTELPFDGSFTGTSVSCFLDGTCPPGTLIITGRKTGEATQLGRFTATIVAAGTFPSSDRCSCDGHLGLHRGERDRLSATAVVTPDRFIPPNVQHVTVAATITGGTGRFAAATGAF